MRYDSFLANLLFGLTLLTVFMSAAHLLSDLVTVRAMVARRFAGLVRTVILIAQ